VFVQDTLIKKCQMFLPQITWRSLYWFVSLGFFRGGTTDLPTHAPTAALLIAFQAFYGEQPSTQPIATTVKSFFDANATHSAFPEDNYFYLFIEPA
jgi:hypothetical protein